MATPVFCCGFECGTDLTHWALAAATFSTTTVRTGSRSLRVNPTLGAQRGTATISSANKFIARVYIRFTTLPTLTTDLFTSGASRRPGVYFNSVDSKLYAGYTNVTAQLGATGVAVTTGIWYRVEMKLDSSANPWTIDVQVDGAVTGQQTNALAAENTADFACGIVNFSPTADMFYDDVLVSQTLADYPLGAGHGNARVPTADGTHNIVTAFKRGTTSTSITNATTTAYQLVDEIPVSMGATDDYIAQVENAGDGTEYAEQDYANTGETQAPTAVEVLTGGHAASGNPCNGKWQINDNGTISLTQQLTTPGTAGVWKTTQFATAPSTGVAWTLALLDAIRTRCGYSTDANPDIYFDSVMIESDHVDAVASASGFNHYYDRFIGRIDGQGA